MTMIGGVKDCYKDQQFKHSQTRDGHVRIFFKFIQPLFGNPFRLCFQSFKKKNFVFRIFDNLFCSIYNWAIVQLNRLLREILHSAKLFNNTILSVKSDCFFNFANKLAPSVDIRFVHDLLLHNLPPQPIILPSNLPICLMDVPRSSMSSIMFCTVSTILLLWQLLWRRFFSFLKEKFSGLPPSLNKRQNFTRISKHTCLESLMLFWIPRVTTNQYVVKKCISYPRQVRGCQSFPKLFNIIL